MAIGRTQILSGMRRAALALVICLAGGSPVFAQDAGTNTPPELRDFRLDPPPPAPTPEPIVPTPVPNQQSTDTPPITATPPRRSIPPVQQRTRPPAQSTRVNEPSTEPAVGASPVAQEQATDLPISPVVPMPPDPLPERSTPTGFIAQQLGMAALLSLVFASVGLLLWRRRRQGRQGPETITAKPAPRPRAKPPAIEPVAPKPSAAPTLHHITMAFVPLSATVSVKSLMLNGELQITNHSSDPADHLSLRAGLVSASKQQKDAMDHFFAQPQTMSSSPIISVKSGAHISLNLELSIALDEMQTFMVDGRSLIVPIVVAHLSDVSGEVARVTCIVGREASPPQPKMGPLRLDQGPRGFDRLGQRGLVS
jgi:hypothetical protein